MAWYCHAARDADAVDERRVHPESAVVVLRLAANRVPAGLPEVGGLPACSARRDALCSAESDRMTLAFHRKFGPRFSEMSAATTRL